MRLFSITVYSKIYSAVPVSTNDNTSFTGKILRPSLSKFKKVCIPVPLLVHKYLSEKQAILEFEL